jgi:hypothetical protein
MFENQSIQYLIGLISSGVFIDGNIVGVSETLKTAKAIVTHQPNGDTMAKEKYISIWESNEQMNWIFLNPLDRKFAYDYTGDPDWHYSNFSKRIVAPLELANQYPQIKVWFDLRNLPIEVVGETAYLYCNEIDPLHQSLVDSLQGIVTIEDRPE